MVREMNLVGKKGRGKKILVDDVDYLRCRKHRWWISHGYAVTIINGKQVPIQNFIMGVQSDYQYMVDHVDLDPLNDTRKNLRYVTVIQNNFNRPMPVTNTTGYKGVSKPKNGRYRARIYVNNKPIYLGVFDTAYEAALAYDAASVKWHGEFGRTNFPRSDYETE